jgi:hypothetical protein
MQLVVAALAAAAALALCTAQTVPTFPVDWTANEVDSNIIHQVRSRSTPRAARTLARSPALCAARVRESACA